MKTQRVGIIMNGVTGRMGTNQHLLRSIKAIREQGGALAASGARILPDPILVGRNPERLQTLARLAAVDRWTTNLEEALSNAEDSIYFDAQTTGRRAAAIRAAIAAGKHIYCEKPVAVTCADALELYHLCKSAGVKHGVVQDKLWLPGIRKIQRLRQQDFFGKILSIRGEFGYWVFEGDSIPPQRPSWNYRREDEGGIIIDMLCHWRYVLDHVFAPVQAVSCLGATHIPERFDESGRRYLCTAEDSAYASFQLEGDVVAHFNSSWCTRVRRDDLLTIQVDGTRGSAVAGLREVYVQHYATTPKPLWNPDISQPIDFFAGWSRVPDQEEHDNAFKVQWELFLRHVACDEPYTHDLLEGARGVQLAELGLRSWKERRWIDLPTLA